MLSAILTFTLGLGVFCGTLPANASEGLFGRLTREPVIVAKAQSNGGNGSSGVVDRFTPRLPSHRDLSQPQSSGLFGSNSNPNPSGNSGPGGNNDEVNDSKPTSECQSTDTDLAYHRLIHEAQQQDSSDYESLASDSEFTDGESELSENKSDEIKRYYGKYDRQTGPGIDIHGNEVEGVDLYLE